MIGFHCDVCLHIILIDSSKSQGYPNSLEDLKSIGGFQYRSGLLDHRTDLYQIVLRIGKSNAFQIPNQRRGHKLCSIPVAASIEVS